MPLDYSVGSPFHRADGALRMRLATVVTARVTKITVIDNQMGISGAHVMGSPPLIKITRLVCNA